MSTSETAWRTEIDKELTDNILAFWMRYTVDEENGGFFGEVDGDAVVRPEADRSLVLITRILWTFSAAYRHDPRPAYRTMADRACDYLLERFTDTENGGMFWMVDAAGLPTQDKKQVYGQAFAVYALSEYHRATGSEAALAKAVVLFRLLENHGYDPVHKGYWEALARDWTRTEDYSLSHHGVLADKTMNTHLHVMEAYTNLYRVWPTESVAIKLRELIALTVDSIVNQETAHFHLFLDEAWNAKSEHISYGHDIEGSWLLTEAAEALGDEALLRRVKKIAIRMAEATLTQGVDADGGLWNEGDAAGLIDRNKDWWPQAEAMVGFYNAYQLTGEERYREAAVRSWRFIDSYLVDKTNGEWYWSVTEDGRPLNRTKANAWKCPYHNGRACLEMLERLEKREPGRS
jgi:mannobiose 2-epimerase